VVETGVMGLPTITFSPIVHNKLRNTTIKGKKTVYKFLNISNNIIAVINIDSGKNFGSFVIMLQV
jgi:predicted regulator of Ras-like GTPase activity (Roadblock/LC7/MglB family)